MKKINIETGVGLFLIIGFICLAYISIKLGDIRLFGTEHYTIKAQFANISGLKVGSIVEIAGVQVGKVSRINLSDYEALVEMSIYPHVKIQDDAIASIRTQGIIGDKYIKITPGGAKEFVNHGDELLETESSIELEELVSKYIFEKE